MSFYFIIPSAHIEMGGSYNQKKLSFELTLIEGLIFSETLFGKLMKTFLPKVEHDERKWHLVDADDQVLGRVAVKIADILRGKDKPVFTPHIDAGDFVVVVNAEKIKLTGQKETGKFYMTYSGWRSGDKYKSVAEVREKHPERILTQAVKGMLPKNRLGSQMLKKLKVYSGPDHPHSAQNPELLTIS